FNRLLGYPARIPKLFTSIASFSKIVLSLGVVITFVAANPLQIYDGCISSDFGGRAYDKVILDHCTYPDQTKISELREPDTYASIMLFLAFNKKAKWGSSGWIQGQKIVPGQENEIVRVDEVYLWEHLKLATAGKNMYLKIDGKEETVY
ncbi:unnamed protein product, partial [Clonostachys chloroleuca]